MGTKCPKCGGEMGAMEYAYNSKYYYDGISVEVCMGTCKTHWGRWCGKELGEKDIEPPFCEGKKHPEITRE